MSASDLISAFATDEIEIIRTGPGDFAQGKFIPGKRRCMTIFASVQPVNANEHLNLPESRRGKETIKIYTTTELNPSDEKKYIKADLILHEGLYYEVFSVAKWDGLSLPHYKVMAQKVDGQGDDHANK